MTTTDNILPDWISRQATLGPNILVDGEQTDVNAFWYLLTVCCPLLFDSYAIVLSPFWINWKVKELVNSGLTIKGEQTEKSDFKRLSWHQFFKLYDKDFDLNTANQTEIEIKNQINLDKWPTYLWFPGEGNCETEELKFILNQAADLYGDTLVNYYYCLLKTEEWDNEIIYRENLSEFDELKNKGDIRENPTAVYPDDKEWCIITDYDLPFTYIGGQRNLLTELQATTTLTFSELNQSLKRRPMKTPAANIGLAIWRLKCFYETSVQGSTVAILLNCCTKNPPHR